MMKPIVFKEYFTKEKRVRSFKDRWLVYKKTNIRKLQDANP